MTRKVVRVADRHEGVTPHADRLPQLESVHRRRSSVAGRLPARPPQAALAVARGRRQVPVAALRSVLSAPRSTTSQGRRDHTPVQRKLRPGSGR